MKKLAIIALAAVAGGASAVQLYDNGTVIDGNSQGTPLSVVDLPAGTYGPNAAGTSLFRVADDFTVTGPGWRLTSISFYSWQSNSPSTFTFNRARFSIVTGLNHNGGVVVMNNDTNLAGQGTVTNGGLVGYRVAAGNELDRSRPIYKVTVTGLNQILLPGAHSLRWSLDGTNQNAWMPSVEPFTYTNGTGSHSVGGGSFNPYWDFGFVGEEGEPHPEGRRYEFPFTINGEVVPEPATMIALGAGIAAIAARRRRK